MTVAGIIAEYNPLHNGHAFLISEMRRMGADCIAVVMSGNFVQRGEPAILSKWSRTKAALLSGADLVVELPLPWAVSGAQHFALGGVSLLSALGADWIGFGSECGNLDRLEKARHALSSPLLHDQIKKSLQSGTTFASARQQAVNSLFGRDTAVLLREPNNVLGIEYLEAVERLNAEIKPYTLKRTPLLLSDEGVSSDAASSSAVRAKIDSGEPFSPYMPEEAYRIVKEEIASGRAPAHIAFAERAVLACLRRMPPEQFSRLPDISEGLENRIFTAVQKAGSVSELFESVKTKRYPMARIRRILLSAFLGIEASDSAGVPPYLRILGIGKNGEKILRRAKERNHVPLISRYADAAQLNPHARRILELESQASDLYALCMPQVSLCGLDRTQKLIVL